jgi:hypothetical protein
MTNNPFENYFKNISNSDLTVYNIQSDQIEYGVSIILRYPNEFHKELDFGDSKLITLIRIFIHKESKLISSLVPLQIEVKFLRCISNDPKEGLQNPTKSNRRYPLNFEIHNEYLFDCYSNQIFCNNSSIEAKELVKSILDKHLLILSFFKGFNLRMKLYHKQINIFKYEKMYKTIDRFAFLLFGFRYFTSLESKAIDIFNIGEEDSFKKDKKDPVYKLSIMGIEAHPWSIVSYCLIHLIAYLILSIFEFSPSIIANVFKSNALSAIYIISTLVIYDNIFKKILIDLRKYFFKKYEKAYFTQINI